MPLSELPTVPRTSKWWSDESAVLVSLKIEESKALLNFAFLKITMKGPQYAFELKTAISSMFHGKRVVVSSTISCRVRSGNGSGSTIYIVELKHGLFSSRRKSTATLPRLTCISTPSYMANHR